MKTILAFAIGILCFSCPARSEDNAQSGRIIRKTRTVACAIDTMWWKWTTHEGLRTFFGQENTMELKVGGPFEIYFMMDSPVGLKGSEGCKVISYLPKEMISFSWNAPPKFPDIRNGEYHTWVVVTFKPVKGNRTEVRINHLGWLKGGEWDKVYEYFDKAWVSVLDWLEKSCVKKG